MRCHPSRGGHGKRPWRPSGGSQGPRSEASPYSIGLQHSVFFFPLAPPFASSASRGNLATPNPTTPQQNSPTPGTDVFATTPHPWLHMSPDTVSAWVPEALDLLFNEWSTHMDAKLRQWVSKHSTPEMRQTVDNLVRSLMNASKKQGLTSVLEGCRTPIRVFTNIQQAVRWWGQRTNSRTQECRALPPPPPTTEANQTPPPFPPNHPIDQQHIHRPCHFHHAFATIPPTKNGTRKTHTHPNYRVHQSF